MRHAILFRLFVVTLLALWVDNAAAQNATVRGFVTELRSEEPLQGANAVLLSAGKTVLGSVTDGDGFFRITQVQPGSYTLRVSFIGFVPWEETVVLRGGETLIRSIMLEVSAGTIDELVVEAEAGSGIAAVTAGLETIRPQDVARIPIPGAAGDLAAYVQSVPGVVLPGDRGGRFHVRGGSDDQNLVLVDGVPIYGGFHILSMFSAFPDEIIDGANFYTGGFSADQGGRLSSVLDVTTRNGNKQAYGGAVTLAPFLSGLRIEGPIVKGKASFLLSGRRSLVEDISPNLFGQNMPFRFGDAFAKAHALIGGGQEVSAFVMLTEDDGQIAGSQYTFRGDPINSPQTDSLDLHWDNRVIGGRYRLLPGALPIGLEATVGHSRYTSTFGPVAAPERKTSLESLDASLEATLWIVGGEWSVGANYRKTDIAYRLAESFRDTPAVLDEPLTEVSAWIQADWSSTSGLDISPGLRIHAVDGRGGAVLEPRIRARWSPRALGGRQRFSAAWGRVHQALSGLTDERDVGNPFTVWVPVPEGESLSSSDHAVLGWNGSFDGGLDLALEVFNKAYRGLQIPVFSALPTFTTALQEADGKAQGLDLRAALFGRPIGYDTRIDATVSYALAEVNYEVQSGETFPPGHDRRHSFSAVVAATRGELTVTLVGQVASGLPFTPSSGFDTFLLMTPLVDVASDPGRQRILYGPPNSARQPKYARFDIWVERRVDRGRTVMTLRAGAMNLLNRANLFYYDLYTFQRVNQLPIVPSVGVKLEFR